MTGAERALRQGRRPPRRRALSAIGGVVTMACGTPLEWQHALYDRLHQIEPAPVLHPAPRETDPSDWVEGFYNNSFVQIGRLVSPGYYLERQLGGPPALDVNDFGKVPDSVWFENRIGMGGMSAERVFVGPDTGSGPASGPLQITKAKLEGITPGFFVKDSAGERWLVKFDVPGFPEMNSAAEVISTKLLYAVGYHVPENRVVRFRRTDLVLSSDATANDRYNRKIAFTRDRLDALLDLLDVEPDGSIRAMFSRFVPGRPVGPFPLQGTRADDPNDRIPHERRRSLRGLWLFYAWLNDTDAKVANGLDAFVVVDTARNLGYLRHYLLDFGSALGSAGHGPKLRSDGYEYNVDWERMTYRYFSFGATSPYWEAVERSPFRGVGVFESAVFDPARWRPQYPNVAFDSADADDEFWAAAILAHVSPAAIDAAVRAGELTEPGAAEWVSRVLRERRDKLLRYGFRGRAPLDDPKVSARSRLAWTDLEQLAGSSAARRYEWQLEWKTNTARFVRRGRSNEPWVDLAPPLAELEQLHGAVLARSTSFDVRLRRLEGAGAPWLTVHLRICHGGELLAVGVTR